MELFISYSHKDEDARRKLENHLVLLRRRGLISIWHDRMISAGDEWAGEIHDALERAGLVLLLISDDFLASDYCYDIEMKRALQRHDSGDARVVPIILRPVDWSSSPFSKLQALPKDGKPVSSWRPKDKAYNDIAVSLRKLISSVESGSISIHSDSHKENGHPGVATLTDTTGIELTIDRDFDKYTEDEQRKLLEAIKRLIEVEGDLRVVSRQRGSIKLRLQMTAAQAERLLWAVKRGELAGFDVTDATLKDDTVWAYESFDTNAWETDVASQDRSVAISTLISKLSVPDMAVRYGAVTGLAAVAQHVEDGARILLPLFRDDDVRIRVLASRVLGRIARYDGHIVMELIDQLLVPDVDIQALTLRSLVEAKEASGPSRGIVMHLLQHSDDAYIHVCAVEVLNQLGVYDSLQLRRLKTAASAGIPEIKLAAIRAIQQFQRNCTDPELKAKADAILWSDTSSESS